MHKPTVCFSLFDTDGVMAYIQSLHCCDRAGIDPWILLFKLLILLAVCGQVYQVCVRVFMCIFCASGEKPNTIVTNSGDNAVIFCSLSKDMSFHTQAQSNWVHSTEEILMLIHLYHNANNGVEFMVWMSKHIPLIYVDVINYPYHNLNASWVNLTW